ncbi:hypothetical protein [Sphingomonas sp. 28-62-11]|uniref:hypothetical protein n=1 Tax=Sphingomonas sp. 28-62-11 TaxID=1970432 RepID=UPI0035A91217
MPESNSSSTPGTIPMMVGSPLRDRGVIMAQAGANLLIALTLRNLESRQGRA